MAAVLDDIAAVEAREDLTRDEKNRLIATYRVNAHIAAFATEFSLPYTVEYDRTHAVLRALQNLGNGTLRLDYEWYLDGVLQESLVGAANAWYVTNPPILIPDEEGEIEQAYERQIYDANDWPMFDEFGQPVMETVTRRFTYDPIAAARGELASEIKRRSGGVL
jgi:hypothetical protein